ncbi:MAG: hypothetical protein MUF72_10320 [Elainella sp. Prado103]|jgi:hypothetical protein|nr:hypothetical protein [Elainella sp. Prado103]
MSVTASWLPVSDAVKRLLAQATQDWQSARSADHLIEQALAETQDQTDVLIAAYRYFFYRNDLPKALQIAQKVMDQVSTSAQWPSDWNQLNPILFAGIDEPDVRLFLTAYSAKGLLLAKLGALEPAKMIATQIKQVDHHREFGADLILSILIDPREDDD